jgi:hypothetical protein
MEVSVPLHKTIHAKLKGSDNASALGIVVRDHKPVLQLCRDLITLGCDPNCAMEVYRGQTLCIRVRSIGVFGGAHAVG